jgi:hypothetical protein
MNRCYTIAPNETLPSFSCGGFLKLNSDGETKKRARGPLFGFAAI